MHPIFLDDTDIYGVYFDFDYDASYNKSLAARAVLVEVTLTTFVYFVSQANNFPFIFIISPQVFFFAMFTGFFDDWDSKPKNFFNVTILVICLPYLWIFLLLSMWEKKGDFWSNNDESSDKRS